MTDQLKKLRRLQKKIEAERGPAPVPKVGQQDIFGYRRTELIPEIAATGDKLAVKIVKALGIPATRIEKVELSLPANQHASVTITRFLSEEEEALILGEE